MSAQDKKVGLQLGFSLVEVLLVIAAVLFLGLLVANLPSAISSVTQSQHSSLAREIASKKIENLRQQTYDNLFNGTDTFFDSSLSGLPGATASFEIADCPVDICSLGEHAKQITVNITWKEAGVDKSVDLTTIISEGGLSQ